MKLHVQIHATDIAEAMPVEFATEEVLCHILGADDGDLRFRRIDADVCILRA